MVQRRVDLGLDKWRKMSRKMFKESGQKPGEANTAVKEGDDF